MIANLLFLFVSDILLFSLFLFPFSYPLFFLPFFITDIDAEKTSTKEHLQEAPPNEDGDIPAGPAPKRMLRSGVSCGQQSSTPQWSDRRHVLPVQCIICKGTKYFREQSSGKRKVEKYVLCERKDGGNLLTAALMKQDEALLLDLRGKDHVAIEVRYHKSCYYRYTKVALGSKLHTETAQQMYERSYSSFCRKIVEERISQRCY